MFLLVMAFSFLAAQIVSKQDFTAVSDLEDILVEHREGDSDLVENTKEIFIIDNTESEVVAGGWERDGETSIFLGECGGEEAGCDGGEGGDGVDGVHGGVLGGVQQAVQSGWRELWPAKLINLD